MVLNGWQRLWVLFSILYLVVVCIVGFVFYKDSAHGYSDSEQKINRDAFYVAECPSILQKYPSGRVPMSQVEDLANEQKRKIARCFAIDRINKKIADDRVKVIQIAAVSWLGPIIVIYLLGLGVMWVRRGFGKG